MTLQLTRRRFTVEDYYGMQRAGILSEGDRVELIEGEIVEMAPIGSLHAAAVVGLVRRFSQLVGDRALISAQNPLRLGEHSEPEPDFMVLKPRSDLYASRHPGPGDALLVVEVADTTLDYDRHVKAPLYARAGVGEMWIVNLQDQVVEVYREPSSQGYLLIRRALLGQQVAPLAFPDVSFAVDDLVLAETPS